MFFFKESVNFCGRIYEWVEANAEEGIGFIGNLAAFWRKERPAVETDTSPSGRGQ
jgi:hypothetical protein